MNEVNILDRTPSPSASPSSSPTSFAPRFPPELVIKVLHFTRPPLSDFRNHEPQQEDLDATQLFCAASLVCREWNSKELGQAALWEEVSIMTEARGQALLQSPVLGVYRTLSLRLMGAKFAGRTGPFIGLRTSATSEIIGEVKGVENLELHSFDRLSFGVLLSPSLSGLKSLTLRFVTKIRDFPTVGSLHLPFSLKSFTQDCSELRASLFLQHLPLYNFGQSRFPVGFSPFSV